MVAAASTGLPPHGAQTVNHSHGNNGESLRQSPSPETVQRSNEATQQGGNNYVAPNAVAAVPGFTWNQTQNPFPSSNIAMLPQAAVTHNLIPPQFNNPAVSFAAQSQQLLAASLLNGTPGHPVLIQPGFCTPPLEPVLTVQDRPMVAPIYNGVNPNYPGVSLLHGSPPIFCVDHFLTSNECDFLVKAASDSFSPAPVVGKGSGEISPSRTSSTCYLDRQDVPDLMRKVTILTGKPVHTCELPQVGRYEPTQQYQQHFDAFDLSTEDGLRFASNGGQRTVTVLIYLNDVANGGQTRFPMLNMDIQPKKGMALVFFPATIDGLLDKMALHAALPAIDTKFVSQVWIRQGEYKGQPSKRLTQTLGVPFGQEPNGYAQTN